MARKNVESTSLNYSVPTMKDLIAPSSFERDKPDYMKAGDRFVRSFLVTGFPKTIGIGWADPIYNSDEDMDTVIHVVPTDERQAQDELTDKITQFEAQLMKEQESGSNRHTMALAAKIRELYEERAKIEQNYINLFQMQMAMNLYTRTEEQLTKSTQLLETALKGKRIKILSNNLRQDQGYKTALPFGKSWLPKNFRNFSSEALTACYPMYNSEFSHKEGTLYGINMQTGTPLYIDSYNRKLLNNGNMAIFAEAGSGKTFLISLITMRSTLEQIRTVIIDPEGEYRAIVEACGGVVIDLFRNPVNPFDLEEEFVEDNNGMPTSEKVVRINEKVADLLGLIGVMVKGMTQEQASLCSFAISDLYSEFGFTADPESLYIQGATLTKDGDFVHGGQKKAMPTFSDLYRKLQEYIKRPGNECLMPLANTLKSYTREGVYGKFDTQTPNELLNYKDAPIISFDISGFPEDGILRTIGMYTTLSWTWEKFIKRNPNMKKRVICDEAWMLVNRNIDGHEYTGKFLETMARRCRKRNSGLCVVSQGFSEFDQTPEGQAVLNNTVLKMFLRQGITDIDAVQKRFKLSDGEREFLQTAQKGQFLLKIGQESTVAYAMPFQYEKHLIERKARAAGAVS